MIEPDLGRQECGETLRKRSHLDDVKHQIWRVNNTKKKPRRNKKKKPNKLKTNTRFSPESKIEMKNNVDGDGERRRERGGEGEGEIGRPPPLTSSMTK